MRWSALLAILGPLLLFGGWMSILTGDKQPRPAREVSDLMKAVKKQQPEVLVIGTSQARAVLRAPLAESLDTSVTVGVFPAARTDHLYRILRGRVFDAGHRPKVVVLAITPFHLLQPAGRIPSRTYSSEIAHPMPELDGRLLGSPLLAPVVRASGLWQERSEDWIEQLTAWTVPPSKHPAKYRKKLMASALGQRSFGNTDLAARMIPVVEDTTGSTRRATIASSNLPTLVALAARYDARLVIATVPQRRPDLRASPESRRKLAAWLKSRGLGFVDFEDLPVLPTHWKDDVHLDVHGAEVYTAALGPALLEIDALGDGPMGQISSAPPDLVELQGTRPAAPTISAVTPTNGCGVILALEGANLWSARLQSLGYPDVALFDLRFAGTRLGERSRKLEPCSGTYRVTRDSIEVQLPEEEVADITAFSLAWDVPFPLLGVRDLDTTRTWLIPRGMRAVWTLDELAEPTSIHITASAVTTGKDVDIRIRGASVPLITDGRLVKAERTVPAGPLTVTVESGEEGPWMVVDAIVFGEGSRAQPWVASPLARPDHVPVLENSTTRKSLVRPGPDLAVRLPRKGTKLTVDLPPAVAAVVHKQVAPITPAMRCSPLRLDGGTNKLFYAADLHRDAVSVPAAATDAETWRVVHQRPRDCLAKWWLYPGDTARSASLRPGALHAVGRVLELRATAFGGPAELHVLLLSDGKTLLDREVRWSLQTEVLRLDLDARLPPAPSHLVLEVSSKANGPYVLLGHAAVYARGATSDL